MPISVGYQSGSHYSSIQALEQYMPAEQIKLSFNDGMLFKRMELLLTGKLAAASLFSGPYYFAEQLGFRKIIDTTFMIATMITGTPDPEDLRSSSAPCAAPSAISICGPTCTRTTTSANSRCTITPPWTPGAGDPASGSCLSRTPRKPSTSRGTGLRSTGSSDRVGSAAARTIR